MTAGQLSTVSVDSRWAGSLGDKWYAKVSGGLRRSDDFNVSRHETVESQYLAIPGESDCLPLEGVPLGRDDDLIYFGSARFDRYLADGGALSMEGGFADYAGSLFLVGGGRAQALDL